jgi:hypothetical protein
MCYLLEILPMHNAFAVVIVGWLVVAVFLLLQGIYTLRTGRITPFFARPIYLRSARGLASRLGYSFVYLVPAVGAFIIIGVTLYREGIDRAEVWIVGNVGMVLGGSLFVVLGLLHLFEPECMLRWTVQTHPELSRNSAVILTARVIGVGLLCLGLGMFATT